MFGKMLFLLHFKLIKFNEYIKGHRHKGSTFATTAQFEKAEKYQQ